MRWTAAVTMLATTLVASTAHAQRVQFLATQTKYELLGSDVTVKYGTIVPAVLFTATYH